jgi:hypothetical protein
VKNIATAFHDHCQNKVKPRNEKWRREDIVHHSKPERVSSPDHFRGFAFTLNHFSGSPIE